MIKTEDIPDLDNSTFSTRVVKDIAQNILSFLKSNCTKEGHTYWLFKGEFMNVSVSLRYSCVSFAKLGINMRNSRKHLSVSDSVYL